MKLAKKWSGRMAKWAVLTLGILVWLSAIGRVDSSETVVFQFNWPVPSRAVVEMELEEEGELSRARFSIEMTAGKDAGELHLTMSDFEFLQLGDIDLNDPAVRAELAPMVAIASALPPLVISTEGEFQRIDNWDELAERVGGLMLQMDPTIEESVIQHVVTLMKDPAYRQQMQSTSARDWRLWVGTWRGALLRPGESKPFGYQMELPTGGLAAATATMSYLVPDTEDPDAHRLRLQGVCDGPDFRQALLASMEKLLPPEERSEEKIAEMHASIGECSMSFDTVAVTDPATLVPTSIAYTKIIRIGSTDGTVEETIEKRNYTFTWE